MKINLFKLFKQFANLVALVFSALAVFAFSSVASAIDGRSQSSFNHMQTGFTLTGAHATLECETCHVGGIFKGTPSTCEGCHAPGRRVIATAKSATHVMTTAPCDTCHTNTSSFLGVRFNHIGVLPKSCSTCHNGVTGPGKPSGHLLTTAQCDSCHRNSAWVPAGFDHPSANPPVINRCADCHNNVTALGKPANHQVTSLQCDNSGCHTNTNYVTFAGLKFDHSTAIPGQCGTCHTGQSAGAPTQPPTHIPYSGLGCDNCHRTPPAATAFNAPMPTMNHGVVVGSMACSKCHNGSYRNQGSTGAMSKADKPGHVSTSSECNSCHYNGYVSFAGGVMDHYSITPPAANRCIECHGSGAGGAKQKTAAHIPTTNQCDACHTGFASFPGGGATMNHAIESGQACAVCHSGGYTSQGSKSGGAKAKPANHVVTGLACNICHIGTTVWTYSQGEIMNHAANGNVTSCKTCHNSPKQYAGQMTTQQLGSHGGSKSTDDCITCHINRYTSWNKP